VALEPLERWVSLRAAVLVLAVVVGAVGWSVSVATGLFF
jgi:hypothetical protein